MLTQEIIRRKRDKEVLNAEEIQFYIRGVTDGSVGEGQVAAMSMAILLNGLNDNERVTLTMAMAQSGVTVDWSHVNLGGPVLDKHSTGGVGDKVSLMLAPIIAACGGYVPMISGRGLGHTGGTLDKMDSIPGYVSQPDLPKLKQTVKDIGCAVVGATGEIAPADKRIYAIRDVTGTVESLDLITASIASKKLAAGLDGLVMDVKFGTGAFMQKYDDAKALAKSIVNVVNGAGTKCSALLTDMNEVLGTTAGNAVEVIEAIEFLRNETIDARLYEVTLKLTGELLYLGGLAKNADEGFAMSEAVMKNGKAAEHFERMVQDLGGPTNILSTFKTDLKLASHIVPVYAKTEGFVSAVDTRAIGVGVIELGGGRRLASDLIDHSVGLTEIAPMGAKVGPNERPLAMIYARDEDTAKKAAAYVQNAYQVSDKAPELSAVVSEYVAL
jgi:thymidine phosphorylase